MCAGKTSTFCKHRVDQRAAHSVQTPMANIEIIVIDSDTEQESTAEEMETESINEILPKSNLT